MSQMPDTEFIGREGVHYVGWICSKAKVAFREKSITDVGIDGEIEFRDAAKSATGLLASVQIKSGDSHVDLQNQSFTFVAEQKNFEYWSRHCLPVLGIVYSPTIEKAVWLNLTEYSKEVVTNNRPCRFTQVLSDTSEFNINNLSTTIRQIIENYHSKAVTKEDLQELSEYEDEVAAWKRLTRIFLNSKSDIDILSDAGYRIALHLPRVSTEEKEYFVDRMYHASDAELLNVIGAIEDGINEDRVDVVEPIAELFNYLPNQVERLKALARGRLVPEDWMEALFQSIELLTQKFETDFREEIEQLYKQS